MTVNKFTVLLYGLSLGYNFVVIDCVMVYMRVSKERKKILEMFCSLPWSGISFSRLCTLQQGALSFHAIQILTKLDVFKSDFTNAKQMVAHVSKYFQVMHTNTLKYFQLK